MSILHAQSETPWIIGSVGNVSLSYGIGVKPFVTGGTINFSLKNVATGAEVLYAGKGLGVGASISIGKIWPVGWEISDREKFPTKNLGRIVDNRLFRRHPLSWEDFEGFVVVSSGSARAGAIAGVGGSVAEMLFSMVPPIVPLFGGPTIKAYGFFASTHLGAESALNVGVNVFSYYVAAVRFLKEPELGEATIGPAP